MAKIKTLQPIPKEVNMYREQLDRLEKLGVHGVIAGGCATLGFSVGATQYITTANADEIAIDHSVKIENKTTLQCMQELEAMALKSWNYHKRTKEEINHGEN